MIEISRREFIRIAGYTAGLFGLHQLGGCESAPQPAGLPTLGGAPDTEQGRAIAALVDTVVPGKHRDPTGAPGGIDAGAPGMFFDPELPALRFVPLLTLLLDGETEQRFPGRLFADLSPVDRELVLEASLKTTPQMEFAVTLAKLAYYASPVAARHLGYPGANDGYVNDPLFSFGRALTTEITGDGNLD